MKKIVNLILLTMVSCAVHSQNLLLPEASQKAMVMQRIGLTDITVSYHSPLVKGRKVWDGLVPYNEVWRAGANENTTISFSTDVMMEGKMLVAGTYGLHMIPTDKDWTIIFSKNHTSWGSFFYDKNEHFSSFAAADCCSDVCGIMDICVFDCTKCLQPVSCTDFTCYYFYNE